MAVPAGRIGLTTFPEDLTGFVSEKPLSRSDGQNRWEKAQP